MAVPVTLDFCLLLCLFCCLAMAPVYEARVIWWLVFLCMAVFPQQFYCTPQVLSTRSTKIVPNANVAAVNILAGRFSDFDKHRLEGYKFIHLETNATWELEQGCSCCRPILMTIALCGYLIRCSMPCLQVAQNNCYCPWDQTLRYSSQPKVPRRQRSMYG